ncbi:MAG: CoA ester lyase [Gammaproteobacteria bacterium]|nr:CoA ester lyase [Gammaproteobacteria bacterium]
MQTQCFDASVAQVSRSFLFVPADSERKLQKADACPADALIVDLEDSVAAARRPRAREMALDFMQGRENAWLRINPLDTEDALADLRAVMPAAPCGICLPKPRGARDSIQLGKLLDVLEQEHDIDAGRTAIMPVATERPEALFSLQDYARGIPRLVALTWGAEDLSTALGASANKDRQGSWLAPYEVARSLVLFAAASAEVTAVDTVFTDFRDSKGLQRFAERARRDGFGGMLAIHPAQIDVINSAMTPSREEIERARHIVALFAASDDAGVVALDGEMIDRPHLVQAQRILQIVDRLEST